MAVPEKVLGILTIENGKAKLEFQRPLQGVVTSIPLAGDVSGPDARFEFEEIPALIGDERPKPQPTHTQPPLPTGTPSPEATNSQPAPVKKRRGRPPKKKAVKHQTRSAVSDVRIPIEAETETETTPNASHEVPGQPESS